MELFKEYWTCIKIVIQIKPPSLIQISSFDISDNLTADFFLDSKIRLKLYKNLSVAMHFLLTNSHLRIPSVSLTGSHRRCLAIGVLLA